MGLEGLPDLRRQHAGDLGPFFGVVSVKDFGQQGLKLAAPHLVL
jgi:hypothetical protein